MTNLIVNPTEKLKGVVKAPPSKSYTIRAVIAGLLADVVSKILDPLYSLDTKAAINVSKELGAKITKKNWGLEICGTSGKIKTPKKILDTLNSGTTIRIAT